MKFSIIYGLLFLQILCLFSCHSKTGEKKAAFVNENNSIEAEVLALGKMRIEAVNQLDTNAFKQISSPDYELINEKGEILNLKKLFQKFMAQKQTQIQEKVYTKSSAVKLFSDNTVAILQGKLTIERRETRGLIVFNMQFSDVYIQEANERWILVHSQVTRLKD